MRSSVMLVPPLLARFGSARIENDVQGCTLGVREIDPHVEVFEGFGAQVERGPGALVVHARRPLHAHRRWLDYASVTTTENFVLCAALADGESELTNAACEPHVQEFCGFMQRMGATDLRHRHLAPDHQRRGRVARRRLHLRRGFPRSGHLPGVGRHHRRQRGSEATARPNSFRCSIAASPRWGWRSRTKAAGRARWCPTALKVREPFTRNMLQKIEAAPWPYFPVDLLPIFIALGVRAEGQMMFWNKVYDGALGWTSELSKFGAHAFQSDPHRVITFGGKPLVAAEVDSPYIIRVAIALLMLASSIEGKSTIYNGTPIRRAHPRFVENLVSLAANIEWVGADA